MSIPIHSLVLSTLATVWDQCAELIKAGTFNHVETPTYTEATGEVTPVNVTKSVNVILLNFKQKQIDGQIVKTGDKKILLRASELATAPAITQPGTDDFITETATGFRWDVIGITIEPTNQFYIIHARRGAE